MSGFLKVSQFPKCIKCCRPFWNLYVYSKKVELTGKCKQKKLYFGDFTQFPENLSTFFPRCQ